jgi:uncharacterized protein (DUF427 family)
MARVATLLRDARVRAMDELRYEPTEKRVRAALGEHTVADSTRAVLVWEPKRVLPSYAVPQDDLRAELLPSTETPPGVEHSAEQPILHGAIPFAVHTTGGEALTVRVGDQKREGAAFRPADSDLSGYVVLDFHAFDAWYEEDEPIVAHPRDPFHRVDIRQSSRHVRIELQSELLAESARPHLVFETSLPVRFYLPREDVRVQLRPAAKRTYCAYKGEASYWAFDVNGSERADLVWSYERPLREAADITGLVAFFDEKVQVTVDGQRRGAPRGAISATILQEAGV